MKKIRWSSRGIRWMSAVWLGGLLTGGVSVLSPALARGDDFTSSTTSTIPSLGYDAADLGSSSSVTRIVGAQTAWASGYTGKGVDVALVDTGVAPVPGLAGPGQVINGPDLSFDSQTATAASGVDAYGHGTFMASLIAGRDPGAVNTPGGCPTCSGQSGYSDTTKFVGVAPDARIVNVKIGAYEGSADVSQLIAGINWVIQHKNDNGMNIKVLNLSYGTQSAQPYTSDPLAYAVEQAGNNGILVVAAGGNDGVTADSHAVGNGGVTADSLASPAYDPHVLAVGADDPNGTLDRSDDTVPDFATHGTPQRGVDVIAPAVHILGLDVPGSFIDQNFGATARVGSRVLRGSGTSQAAAITSGVAAILYQKFPDATPDQMKKLIKTSAFHLANSSPLHKGTGIVDAAKALDTKLPVATPNAAAASDGLGTLEAARGTTHLAIAGHPLLGEQDIFGHPWNATTMATSSAQRTTWTGGQWNANQWTGNDWTDGHWATTTWPSPTWAATNWTDPALTPARWTGASWTGASWTGASWTGASWTGASWS